MKADLLREFYRRVIVVFGATGAQGGSVARALHGDNSFHVRAATRNPESSKAKDLAAMGMDVIKVDMDDKMSCREALKSAYGVFLTTNYWEINNADREFQQGKNVADAAKDNKIQHVVYSGLKSAEEHIGKKGCHHFESKKQIHDYIIKQGLQCSTIDLAAYYENLLSSLKPRKSENNEYVLDIPMGKAPLDMVYCDGCGEIVRQIFRRPDEFKGKWLSLASSRMTIAEYAATLTKVLGRKFVAGPITVEEYAKLGFQGAEDLAIMFEFFSSGKCDHDIDLTRSLNPEIPTFEQWVHQKRALFDAAFP